MSLPTTIEAKNVSDAPLTFFAFLVQSNAD